MTRRTDYSPAFTALLNAGATAGTLDIRRAWPGKDCDIHAEAVDANQRVRGLRIHRSGKMNLLDYATDSGLPGLHPEADADLVVHRYGKRAVVLTPTRVHKFVRPGKARGIAQAWESMSTLCQHAGIHTPSLEGSTDSHLTFPLVDGTTLHDWGDNGIDGWQAYAQLWPQLAGQRGELSPYTPQDEARTLNTWFAHVRTHASLAHSGDEAHMGALGRAVDMTTAQLLDTAQATPPEQWVTTHRDLHDKQILWDGKRITLLDADTAVMAEPALDIANMRAHIDLRFIQGKISADMHARLKELTSGLAQELAVTQHRLHTYENASKLRLACVYSFRPAAHAWLGQWAEHTLSHTTD